MEQNAINRLVENHPEMYALDQVFYNDIDIYAIDIEPL